LPANRSFWQKNPSKECEDFSMKEALGIDEFSALLQARFSRALCGVEAVAVGLSGGPDSMALTWLLSQIGTKYSGPHLHAITVDHGLRPESAAEAESVAKTVKDWPHMTHAILRWEESVSSRIQEEARHARYELMAEYCREHGIRHLFLAHHIEDQAETFLFRLAKGSGLDGLAGMRAVQEYGGLFLLRPLLEVSKERLLATCVVEGIVYVQDPSNEKGDFARVRLRKSRAVLREEGLTSKRLGVTAARLARARAALEEMANRLYDQIVLENGTSRIVLRYEEWAKAPEELALRVFLKSIAFLRPEADYAPRLESIEEMFADLRKPEPFRKRTLGGLVFTRDDKEKRVIIAQEDGI
jgi:tRNA(Ile)-lysidine synthase